jgi:shikimate kinase
MSGMNIVLTGYRATGKTTVGALLAKKLKKEFIDTDDIIEAREHMSIRALFQKHGWKYFRRIEKRVIKDLAKKDNAIIAVGGGAFMYKANLMLKENATVVLLTASAEVISKRMEQDHNRPPLTHLQSSLDEIRAVWNRRKERYYDVADIVVDTSSGDTKKIVAEIVTQL